MRGGTQRLLRCLAVGVALSACGGKTGSAQQQEGPQSQGDAAVGGVSNVAGAGGGASLAGQSGSSSVDGGASLGGRGATSATDSGMGSDATDSGSDAGSVHLSIPHLMPQRQIEANGISHTCALSEVGVITCWGNNNIGQLDAPTGTGFVQLALGDRRSCALRDDGTVTCWGAKPQLGGEMPAGGVASIDAMTQADCALLTDGTGTCWGDNIASTYPRGDDVPLLTAIGALRLWVCGLTEHGEIRCWGEPDFNVPRGKDFVAMSAGEFDVCGLHASGTISCSDYGPYNLSPLPAYDDFVQVSVGTNFACARRSSGAIVCWGDNTFGQATAPDGNGYTWVSAGHLHSCALRADGKAVCWGGNNSEQLDPVGEFAP